jgi:ubiquinone/menaquinone biosynthesis C-methylase UbiE
MTSTTTPPDFTAIKSTQRAGWETGDYPRVGNTLTIMAEELVEAADVRAGERVLDVACGQGNAALAAARRFAVATGVDYARNLIEQARRRAEVENLAVTFLEGDAEDLPVPDASSDLTVSTVGAMFAPDHQRTADELVRVTAPGGRIALASWTPSGMIGQLFKTVGTWAPPPAGVRPPALWGTPEHLAELFGDRVEWTRLETRTYTFRYHSPAHFSEWFREFYGPITRLAGTLSGDDLLRFADDLADVTRGFNRATDGTLAGAAEYLQAVGVRRA